jgi:RNA polymerase sigma-70 factor (ECF subfamily)
MEQTPASLLERLRRPGDPEAWARFVALYTPLIYSWCRRAGLQDQDAADLTQDVFVTLLQVLPRFAYDRHKSFRRWLQTITLNKWRNARRQQSHQAQPGHAADLDGLAATSELEACWEAEYQQHLAARALRVMQADFQETTWRACWEVVVGRRTPAAVAADLGLTVAAVYAAKFRVLGRLRQELQGLFD